MRCLNFSNANRVRSTFIPLNRIAYNNNFNTLATQRFNTINNNSWTDFRDLLNNNCDRNLYNHNNNINRNFFMINCAFCFCEY